MKQIPMLDLKAEYGYMKSDIDRAITTCLDHQRWIFGPEVQALEDTIAEYVGVKHCIGTCSGTEALVLSLRALAIKTKDEEYFRRDDEIITTPFTFTATGDAILRAGATPVFVDIDPVTFNINVPGIKDYIASNSRRVVGILPVHLYGRSCDMDRIMEIAKANDLFVVEDVAQAFGGMFKGRKLGSIGTAGSFSFFPSKNLGGFGDGGMVSTDDDELAGIIRMLIKHGGKDKYNVDHIGYNARLDTLQAAIVSAKMKYIDEFNDRRRAIAALYNEGLSGLDSITLPVSDFKPLTPETGHRTPECYHVYHQYTIRTSRRDELQTCLQEKGIASMVYYPHPLHKMKVFSEGRSKTAEKLAESEKAVAEVLSLPIEPLHKEEDTDYVITCLCDCINNG